MVLTLMLGQGLCRLRRVQFDPALFLRQFHQLSGDGLREVEGGLGRRMWLLLVWLAFCGIFWNCIKIRLEFFMGATSKKQLSLEKWGVRNSTFLLSSFDALSRPLQPLVARSQLEVAPLSAALLLVAAAKASCPGSARYPAPGSSSLPP